MNKFRVFAKANTKTVDGLGYDKNMMHDQVSNIDFYNQEVTVWGCGKENCGMCDDTYKLEDVILMQSTGLHDVNGKEIFEGDVVRAEHENFSMDEVPPEYKPYIGFIKYIKTGYSIITKDTYHPCLSNIRITNIEIIGNIHENSDLLK